MSKQVKLSSNVVIKTVDYCSGDESNDSWYLDHDITLTAAKLVRPDQFFDVTIAGKLKKGQQIFVVYVNYSTGDSFGNESGLIQIISGYSDLELAERAVDILKADAHQFPDDETTIKLPLSRSVKFPYSTSAYKGYFETVSGFQIEKLVLS